MSETNSALRLDSKKPSLTTKGTRFLSPLLLLTVASCGSANAARPVDRFTPAACTLKTGLEVQGSFDSQAIESQDNAINVLTEQKICSAANYLGVQVLKLAYHHSQNITFGYDNSNGVYTMDVNDGAQHHTEISYLDEPNGSLGQVIYASVETSITKKRVGYSNAVTIDLIDGDMTINNTDTNSYGNWPTVDTTTPLTDTSVSSYMQEQNNTDYLIYEMFENYK